MCAAAPRRLPRLSRRISCSSARTPSENHYQGSLKETAASTASVWTTTPPSRKLSTPRRRGSLMSKKSSTRCAPSSQIWTATRSPRLRQGGQESPRADLLYQESRPRIGKGVARCSPFPYAVSDFTLGRVFPPPATSARSGRSPVGESFVAAPRRACSGPAGRSCY